MPRSSLSLHRRKQAREFQHSSGAGSVVVGAGMDLADLRGRQRVGITAAQVIVMRADDDVLVGLARKIGQHVVHPRVRRLDVHLHGELQRLRKSERRRLAEVVDLLLDLSQRLAGRLEPALGDGVLHLQQHDADVLRPAYAAEAHEQIFFAVAEFPVDQHHRLGAVIARVDRLGDQLRMLRQPVMAALLAEDLGLIAEHTGRSCPSHPRRRNRHIETHRRKRHSPQRRPDR